MPGFLVCLRRAVCPITTCVGNTSRPSTIPTSSTVHPHMRGEYRWSLPDHPCRAGSSPRAWGIPASTATRRANRRFIPTCVGNTCDSHYRCCRGSVHPHVRGEYINIHCRIVSIVGSSPRAWGIQSHRHAVSGRSRFIPTCVGNTRAVDELDHHLAVHPHVRGEYFRQVSCI